MYIETARNTTNKYVATIVHTKRNSIYFDVMEWS